MSRNYDLAPSWRVLCARTRAELRWVTIIIGAIRVSDADDPAALSSAVSDMVEEFRLRWLGMTRGRALPGLIWRGVIELELHRDSRPGSHRHALLEDLECDTSPLEATERVVVVHTHLVAVLPDGIEADDLRGHLAAVWQGRWRTQVKGLQSDQTIEEAVTALCGYCHKHRLQYTSGGLNSETVVFGDSYGKRWGGFVEGLYVGLEREFRSKK